MSKSGACVPLLEYPVSKLLLALVILSLCLGTIACSGALQGLPSSTSTNRNSQSSNGKPVTIAISPDSPTVGAGGKIQLSAIVSNTSDTAVVWSANGGKIDPSGVFTAPSAQATQSFQVTAKSMASGAEASIAIVVMGSSSRLQIASTSLPRGTAGTPYTFILEGIGGVQPYSWSVVSGSLPEGMQIDAGQGTLAGLTNSSGTYGFTMQITDANRAVATQPLQLTIAALSTSKCGPPKYPCSRTDGAVIAAKAPPQLGANPNYRGGHLGAGMVAVDPSYNNRILRVTDGITDATRLAISYQTGSSAEKNVMSYDESMFILHNASEQTCLFGFDAAHFASGFHGCMNGVGSGQDFGYTAADAHAYYGYSYQKLHRFVVDPANWTITSDPTFNNGLGYFDPDSPNCLNGLIKANHWYTGDSALSSDDNTYIVAIGPAQDMDPYYVVWNKDKGCQWMNVKTWEVSRGWNTGLSNPQKISWASGTAPSGPGGIHNAQIDRSGTFGVLTINGTSLDHKVFWTIGTNQVDDTCESCKSHWACDFGVCFWEMGPGTGYSLMHQDIGSLSPVLDVNTNPVKEQWGNDEHMSHANATPGERSIYLASWQPGLGSSSVSQVWEDELIGVNWDGTQRTIRFNKNWSSGYGGFNGSSRCSISRQGHYALCTSDLQMYNLDKGFGDGFNHDTCDHKIPSGLLNTTGCRTDVLLFELR